MTRILFVFAILLACCGVLFAQDATTPEDASQGITFLNYGGLAAWGTLCVGVLKKMSKGFFKGKEQFIAFGVVIITGAIVKVIGAAYGDVTWPAHIAAMLAAGIGSGLIHDKVVNNVIKEKPHPPNA